MANNCVTTFLIVSNSRGPLEGLAGVFNSLKTKYPKNPEYYWGQQSLRHLYDELRCNDRHPELRGYIDSDTDVEPSIFMSGLYISDEPFTVTDLGPGRSGLCFSMVSAWYVPSWFTSYLDGLCREHAADGFTYAFLTTDEFHGFHHCRRGDLIGSVYQIDHPQGDNYNYGQEQAFIENLASIIGFPLTEEIRRSASRRDFQAILQAVDDYNESAENGDVYVHIYEEIPNK